MDKERIHVAVTLLVKTARFAELKKELLDLIRRQEDLPRRFSRDLEPLNALIDLHETSEQAFGNVMQLVTTRRATKPDTSKPDYMRSYMQQRRARENLALTIEELDRGGPLAPAARKNFKAAQILKWMEARDAYVATHGELTWHEKNIVVADFWEKIDAQLENQLAEARVNRTKRK